MTTKNPTNISPPPGLAGGNVPGGAQKVTGGNAPAAAGRKSGGGSAMAGGADARVNCPKCEHYYVTWDTAFPRGCKLYGFKTAALPSYTVHEVTGGNCEHYKSKT